MSFNTYTIDQSDFEFFDKLPDDEKILFLYDLICVNAYGKGSTEQFNLDTDTPELKTASFEEVVETFKTKLQDIVASTINDEVLVNVLFINDFIVFNSESKNLLDDAVYEMFVQGYLIREKELTMQQLPIFHHQRYCKVYEIIGITDKISMN
jgi:hypothetical protein